MLVIQYLKEFNAGYDGNEVLKIMVVLKFKRQYLDHGSSIDWKYKFINFKLECPGLPNQYPPPKNQRTTRKKVGR